MNRKIAHILVALAFLPSAMGADDELTIKPKAKETVNTLARWEAVFHIYAKGNAKDAETKVTVDCPSGKPLTYYPLVKGKPYEVIKKENVPFDLKPDELKKTYTISAACSWGSSEYKDSAQITVTNAAPTLAFSFFKENCPYIKKTNTTEKNYKANDKLAFGSCTIATMTFFDVENGKPQGLPSEIPAKFYVVDSKGKAEDVTHKKPFVLIFKQASIMRRNEFYLVVKPNDYDSKYYSGEYYFKAVFSLKQLQEVTDEAKQKAKTTADFPTKDITVNIVPEERFSRAVRESLAKHKRR